MTRLDPALRITQFRFATRLLAARLALPAMLARLPIPRVLHWLESDRRTSRYQPGHFARPRHWIERGLTTLRFVPDTCLYRALARYSAMRDAGIPVRFVMGVRREDGAMTGHAWVELHGRGVGEVIDPRFTVTFAHPGGPGSRVAADTDAMAVAAEFA